jgi:uncharacterized protein (TIGR00369 family)
VSQNEPGDTPVFEEPVFKSPVFKGSMPSIRPELLGWRFVQVGDGIAVMEWTPGPDLANPVGNVHGGWVGALVDDVSGAALVSLLTEPRPFPTVSMHIEFIRPIAIGETHTVRGAVVRAGKRVTVCDATITDANGRLLARASTTFSADLEGHLRPDGAPVAGFTALG